MFKKLLSNLPFNPSLITQVSFYAKRIHSESSIRRLGFFFVALAMLMQLFAVVSPPEPTLAESANDIIRGGFDNSSQATLYCLDTNKDIGKILTYYGVDCGMVSRAETTHINSRDFGGNLDSLGRNPIGGYYCGRQTGQYVVNISGVQQLYMKNLWAWDCNKSSNTYKVLKITNNNNRVIYIMYDCGNIVTIGEYSPPAPPPPPPTPTPTPTPTPPPPTGTPAVCVSLVATQLSGQSYQFRAQSAGSNFVVTGYLFTFGDGNSKRVDTGSYAASVDHSYARNGSYVAKVSIYANDQATGRTVARTLACQAPVTIASTPTPVVYCTDASKCLALGKVARNITQNVANADGTTANAGDQIVYTLTVKNIGDTTFKAFKIEENISDILDYATIASYSGGTFNQANGYVTWPGANIAAGQTISKTLTIKVKDPIPDTPVSASDPTRFDLIMNNVYGNSINIKLPPSFGKTSEQVVQTLPNTGPGESIALVSIITVITGYFFARSRLMAKELDIVKTEFATTGEY